MSLRLFGITEWSRLAVGWPVTRTRRRANFLAVSVETLVKTEGPSLSLASGLGRYGFCFLVRSLFSWFPSFVVLFTCCSLRLSFPSFVGAFFCCSLCLLFSSFLVLFVCCSLPLLFSLFVVPFVCCSLRLLFSSFLFSSFLVLFVCWSLPLLFSSFIVLSGCLVSLFFSFVVLFVRSFRVHFPKKSPTPSGDFGGASQGVVPFFGRTLSRCLYKRDPH